MISTETKGDIEALFDEIVGIAASEVNQSRNKDRKMLDRFGLEEEALIQSNLPYQSLETIRLEKKFKVLTNAQDYFHASMNLEDATVNEHSDRQKELLSQTKQRIEECDAANNFTEKNLIEGLKSGHQEVISILEYFREP